MEVSGYPHYENVSSNILAFYFDPAAEHGLKDLLVSAFLQMAGVKEVPPLSEVAVSRERGTDEGKRIDLIIDSEAFTIGIENKIYHWLANDLEQYAQVIDRLGLKKNIVIKAVLGLQRIQVPEQLKGGFSSYTYCQLWQHVRAMLGHYISNADPKWVAYLIDFMETTTNLAGQNMELQKTDQFFIAHNDLIEKMIAERNAFLARLKQKVLALCTMMSDLGVAAALSRPPWVYDGSCVVLDFVFLDAYAISFDLYLRPTGWEMQLFGRNNKSMGYLHKLISQPSLHVRAGNAPVVGNRHILQTWPIQTDLGAIKEAVCSWMDALINATKTASN
jgi:hypothetical protein